MPEPTSQEQKTCRVCKRSLPIAVFPTENKKTGRLDTRCRECGTKYQVAWEKRNRAKRNSIVRKNCSVLKSEMIDAYGGMCVCCGESRFEFLSIDHVRGNGSRQRREAIGKGHLNGSAFYRWLKRNGWPKEEFRLLCYNCNLALGLYGRCPHGNGLSGGRRAGAPRKYERETETIDTRAVNPARNLMVELRKENEMLRAKIAVLESRGRDNGKKEKAVADLPLFVGTEEQT